MEDCSRLRELLQQKHASQVQSRCAEETASLLLKIEDYDQNHRAQTSIIRYQYSGTPVNSTINVAHGHLMQCFHPEQLSIN